MRPEMRAPASRPALESLGGARAQPVTRAGVSFLPWSLAAFPALFFI